MCGKGLGIYSLAGTKVIYTKSGTTAITKVNDLDLEVSV